MLEQIILWIFLSATAIQLFFWLYFFSRVAFHREKSEDERVRGGEKVTEHSTTKTPSVSVIICAHNEAENLKRHLHRFLNQSYRSFEVLLVLHNSHDESSNILAYLQRQFDHLKVIECDDPRSGKKIALAKGIEAADNEVLLLTDADCVPASDHWISGMVAGMENSTQIVLGVSPYLPAKGKHTSNPLNVFIRYEACYTAIQYLSFALAGLPYMGVGRNLAYRRSLFKRTGGFHKHEHLASGDDDLFINEAAQGGTVEVRLNPDTYTYSLPKQTWREYYRQKTRHFSTGKFYKLHHQTLLAILAVSHFLHYVGAFFLIILKISIIFALLGYAVRMSVVWWLSAMILDRLKHKTLIRWTPVFDAALILFYLLFTPAILMNKNTQQWN